MKKSENKQVQQFLEDMMMLEGEKHNILQELRDIVFKRYPDVNERIIYGGIMFSLEDDFGGVFVSKNHVSFEFGSGYQFDDPKKTVRRNWEISSSFKN